MLVSLFVCLFVCCRFFSHIIIIVIEALSNCLFVVGVVGVAWALARGVPQMIQAHPLSTVATAVVIVLAVVVVVVVVVVVLVLVRVVVAVVGKSVNDLCCCWLFLCCCCWVGLCEADAAVAAGYLCCFYSASWWPSYAVLTVDAASIAASLFCTVAVGLVPF